MNSNDIQQYFEVNSQSWLDDAYSKGNYNYPVGLQRLRIISTILSNHAAGGRLVDFGCGGGDLCMTATKLGYDSLGVDRSKDMLNIAQQRANELSNDMRNKISFLRGEFVEAAEQLAGQSFDIVTAMGFIGYLEVDEQFFSRASGLVQRDGKLIVSCRNRLFNMVSGSKYTLKEIEQGTASALIEELEDLYMSIPEELSHNFVGKLNDTASGYLGEEIRRSDELKPLRSFTGEVEARQHTPKELAAVAAKFGLRRTAVYGVHPHIVSPRLNSLLPPQLYNRLSDCLTAFESHPVSLTWSSVFISVFEKEDI